MKEQIVKELKDIMHELMEPFSGLMNIGGYFFELFTDIFDVFKSVKEAYVTLKKGYVYMPL